MTLSADLLLKAGVIFRFPLQGEIEGKLRGKKSGVCLRLVTELKDTDVVLQTVYPRGSY